jgi:hypothetical protein
VPINQVRLSIVGIQPLIMHNNRGVNPREPLAQQMKALTKQRTKTEDDLDAIARYEWELGLYHDTKIGPYLPDRLILATLREAAKKTKQGKLVVEAVFMDDPKVRIEYDGPRDIDGLAADGRFFDLRPVRVQTATINRARPIFHPPWSLELTLNFDPDVIDEADLIRIVETAGRRIGFGDYRPVYGRFTVTQTKKGK